MTILVGYLDTPEGRAALDAGIAEARCASSRSSSSTRPGAARPVDDDMLARSRSSGSSTGATDRGVRVEVRQPLHGDSLADTLECRSPARSTPRSSSSGCAIAARSASSSSAARRSASCSTRPCPCSRSRPQRG